MIWALYTSNAFESYNWIGSQTYTLKTKWKTVNNNRRPFHICLIIIFLGARFLQHSFQLPCFLPFWNHGLRTSLQMRRSCHSTSSSTPLDWDSKGPENSILSPSSPCQYLELYASLSMLFYELKKGDNLNHACFSLPPPPFIGKSVERERTEEYLNS